MAFKLPQTCYPRVGYFYKRHKSIKPRLLHIIDEEYRTQNMTQSSNEKNAIEEITKLVDNILTENIRVKLIGDKCTRQMISERHITVKPSSDITFESASRKHENTVHVLVIEFDSSHKKKFISDIDTYLTEVPELERQYVVLAVIPRKPIEHETVHQTLKKVKQLTETSNSNFDFSKCVIILPMLEKLKQQEAEANKVATRQSTLQKHHSPSRISEQPSIETDRREPSPPKKRFSPDRTQETAVPSTSSELSDYKKLPVCKDVKAVYTPRTNEEDETAVGKAISYQLESKAIDIIERMENFLVQLKKRRDEIKGADQFTTLDKILYEIRGLYNVSETKKGLARKAKEIESRLSRELAYDLLKLDHVKGCGRIYGKLDVHVESDMNQDENNKVKSAIERVVRKHKYGLPYNIHFIKEICTLGNIIITVE